MLWYIAYLSASLVEIGGEDSNPKQNIHVNLTTAGWKNLISYLKDGHGGKNDVTQHIKSQRHYHAGYRHKRAHLPFRPSM